MTDWERLLDELHKRDMKLIMDLVVNHTSDEHEWFKESRSSKTNPKRNWYHWMPARIDKQGNRHPPNNWKSIFGMESAWQWDEVTEEYYLRLFTKEQPDLNWTNGEVREAVYALMKFWLDKGIDGFRLDVINLIAKAEGYPDAEIKRPDTLFQVGYAHHVNLPKVHEYLQEMNAKVLSKYDVMTVGETPFGHDTAQALLYARADRKELNMIFQFELMDLDGSVESPMKPKEWKLVDLKKVIEKWQLAMSQNNGWNSLYLENHDQARSISRWGSDKEEFRLISGKMLAIFHSSLGGTPYIYQGQDIGMVNVPKEWTIDEYKDVATQLYYKAETSKRENVDSAFLAELMTGIQHKARDNARTPMQWNHSDYAGFTKGTPWMSVNPDYKKWNADAQVADKYSIWNMWKRLFILRKEWLTLVYGEFVLLSPEDPSIFAYLRKMEGQSTALVLLNFSTSDTTYTVPNTAGAVNSASLVIGNYDDEGKLSEGKVTLKPYEGRIYRL